MTETAAAPESAPPEPTAAATSRQSLLGRYGEQLALPFAWLLVVIFFSIQEPDLFPTTRNLGSLLGTQTALFILALAALLPAMAGDLDLSLGWVGAFGAMVMAVLNTQHDWGIVPAALVALAIGAGCGLFNGFVVVKLKTEPFIMTLGTGAIFQGMVLWVSDSNSVTNVSSSLSTWTLHT
jgi:ribose transport system permease protein